MASYEANKAKRLNSLENDLKNAQTCIKEYTKDLAQLSAKTETYNAQIASLLVEEDELKLEMSKIHTEKTVGETEEYQNALAEVNRIKDALDAMTADQRRQVEILQGEEALVSEELIGYEQAIAANSVNENIDNQIEMLRKKQIEYEQSRADAEQILYQVSLLNKRKNELLTDDINKHFKYVKWVLFRYAKNGNYEDCCVPTIDGKELGVSTNNALGIRAKVDICEGMQRYYGQSYPILLDNIEAIDTEGRKALVSDSQLIMFAVTDTALTVKEA